MSEPHTPSEAYKAGKCPACLGHGRVDSAIRGDNVPCGPCDGTGELETMLRIGLRDDN